MSNLFTLWYLRELYEIKLLGKIATAMPTEDYNVLRYVEQGLPLAALQSRAKVGGKIVLESEAKSERFLAFACYCNFSPWVLCEGREKSQ